MREALSPAGDERMKARDGSEARDSSVSLITIGAISVMAACGGDGGPAGPVPPAPPPPPSASVASLELAPDTAATVPAASFALQAVALDADGNQINDPQLSWTTSDGDIADVDAAGLISASTVGEATITATADGVEAEAAVQVIEEDFLSVRASGVFTCGLMGSGKAYCWGGTGLLGDGSTKDDLDVPNPVPVSGGLTFTSLDSGSGAATCGTDPGGTIHCWGSNGNSELGAEAPDPCGGETCAFVPIPAETSLQFGWAGSEYKHSCGLTDAGEAYCWGFNPSGQVGVPASAPVEIPVAVETDLQFQAVSGGFNHTCGLATDGTAHCWGSDAFVKGPDGDRGATLAEIGTDLSFERMDSDGWHACGVTDAGDIYCWGSNEFGQLGATSADTCGEKACSLEPIRVDSDLSFSDVATGWRHTCALTESGAAYCWGDGQDGKLGDGTAVASMNPVGVEGGLTFSTIDAGRFHTCGVTTDRAAYCWGWGGSGQLGNGSLQNGFEPVRVFGPR